MDMLNKNTKQKHYDYLVFTIGTWYNWNWENDIDTSAQVDWTMNTLKTHCPSGLRDELFTQKDVYKRALLSRSKCKKLLSMKAYVSGLKKLKKIATPKQKALMQAVMKKSIWTGCHLISSPS